MLPALSPHAAERLINGYVMAGCDNWSVLKASGANIRDYLQGQITQDMGRLTSGQGIHACVLTPQGKAISELYMLEGNNGEIIMLTPKNYAIATVTRLRQFALGYQVRIGIVEDRSVLGIAGAHAAGGLRDINLAEPGEAWLAVRHSDADAHVMLMPASPRGFWMIAQRSRIDAILQQIQAGRIEANEMEAMRIIHGLPMFGVEWDAGIHPLNANMIEFAGVSFEKGCYVGQEVTSRMHWRKGIRKRLYRVEIDGRPAALPCPVFSKNRIGELRSAALNHEQRCFGIALLPIATVESDALLRLEGGASVHALEACHV